jgi:predicted nuclease of predicted toxin-antitoxin system
MLRLLADECVYKTTLLLLKSYGYDVISIKDLGKSGFSDKLVLEEAKGSNRILLTADQDFGNILAYPPETHCGVIVLKISKEEEKIVHANLLRMLSEIEPSAFAKSLIIVDRNKYRVRYK